MKTATPSVSTLSTTTLVALRAGFWRVVHPSGRVLGYIEETRGIEARSFTARRLVANTTRLVEIGEFWSVDDARQCFA